MRPYVIACPSYRKNSAGPHTLHLLCHLLNELEVPAYLAPGGPEPWTTRPGWRTPLASPRHLREGIVIYSETVQGNPMQARRVVRWLLAQPDRRLGRDPGFGADDYLVALSRIIDDRLPTLTIYCIDVELFHSRDLPQKTEDVLWVGKGSERPPTVNPFLCFNRTRITHTWPAEPRELADLLRRSRSLVSFDPFSSINCEATLCGALCIIVSNGPLTRADLERGELGLTGMAWKTDQQEIARARASLPQAYPNYLARLAEQPSRILEFVRNTQAHWPADGVRRLQAGMQTG